MNSVVHPYTRSSEEEVAALLDGFGQGFYSVDREWRVVRFNQLAAVHFNRRRADVVGRVLWDAFPLAEKTSLGKKFFDAMASRQPMTDEAVSVIATNRILSYRLFPLGAGLGIIWHEAHVNLSRSLDPALDALPFGIVRVFENLQVAAANPAALRIMDAGDGLCLAGTVTAVQKADNMRLQQAIRCAIETRDASFSARLSIRRRSDRRSYLVRVFSQKNPMPSAILTIVDPEVAPAFKDDELIELYGLSRSESRVVWMLAAGKSLAQIADALGIGFETARTHLARARAKTQTSSQVDLVRLLTGSL